MIASERATLDFDVPPQNEAREPAEARGVPRDRVRLLVSDRRRDTLVHARFDAIATYLRPSDLLVANDSATLPAALVATRENGAALIVHVADEADDGRWIVEPRGDTVRGERFALPGGLVARIDEPVHTASSRLWYARTNATESRDDYLRAHGAPIRYAYVGDGIALPYYQTIFARAHGPGSAEMPSAGRPFTARTIETLRAHGIDVRTITLHTGVSSPEAHEPPQPERYAVSEATASAVNRTRAIGGRVIAIGTTAVRALESSVRSGEVVASSGRTERIVSPAVPPQVVNGLLTGFHEPRASHLTLLETFLERGALQHAYETAVAAGYLWHEFGDVHLIL